LTVLAVGFTDGASSKIKTQVREVKFTISPSRLSLFQQMPIGKST
jgi:hypothetical protein